MKIAIRNDRIRNSPIPWRIAALISVSITLVNPPALFSQTNAPDKSLHQLFDTYYEDRLKLFPLEATGAGDSRYNDLLPNSASDAFRRQTHDFYFKYKNSLAHYKRETLSPVDKVSYDILQEILERELEGEKLHLEYIPFAQFYSLSIMKTG